MRTRRQAVLAECERKQRKASRPVARPLCLVLQTRNVRHSVRFQRRGCPVLTMSTCVRHVLHVPHARHFLRVLQVKHVQYVPHVHHAYHVQHFHHVHLA